MQPRWGCAACHPKFITNIKSLRDLEKRDIKKHATPLGLYGM